MTHADATSSEKKKTFLEEQEEILTRDLNDCLTALKNVPDEIKTNGEISANSKRCSKKIPRLTAAIRRIHIGEYNRCQDCSEEIGIDALRLCPTREYCSVCMKKH